MEQEENDTELGRTGDEIEGENLTNSPAIEHDDEEPRMARFDDLFAILHRLFSCFLDHVVYRKSILSKKSNQFLLILRCFYSNIRTSKTSPS